MKIPILFLCLVLLWGCGKSSTEQASKEHISIANPVIRGEFPDPSVIKVDGVYYACGTSNDWAPIYPIYSSKDLNSWELLTYVFMEAPDWTMGSFWAPELYYKDGTFYCYYTARRKSDQISCIGVATTKDIQKGFTDHGVLIEWGSESIDAYVYEDAGQPFVTWKAYGLDPEKPIEILGSKLSKNGLELEGEVFTVVTAEADTWERGGIEGQSIVKNGDYLYLLYSGAACCGGGCDYKVGVARAKTMEGPWEKYSGNPILTDFGDWKCPGHGTPLHTGDDQWYYLYHAYAKDGFPYMGRSALLNRFYWDGEKGWPYFKVSELIADSEQAKPPVDIVDDFEGEKLQEWWRWDLASNDPEVSIEEGQLKMSERQPSSKKSWANFLGLVPEAASYEVELALGQERDLKGLALYGTSQNLIGLGVDESGLRVFELRDGNYKELSGVLPIEASDIELKAEVREGHLAEFFYRYDAEWKRIALLEGQDQVVKGDFLSFWQWGVKPGIFVKRGATGSFDALRLTYRDK